MVFHLCDSCTLRIVGDKPILNLMKNLFRNHLHRQKSLYRMDLSLMIMVKIVHSTNGRNIMTIGKLVEIKISRVHREPRYRMFCPTNVVDCPIPVDWLLPGRETQGSFHGTHDWNTTDVWQNNPQGHQSLPMHWTGETVFHVKAEYIQQIPQVIPKQSTTHSGIALSDWFGNPKRFITVWP